MTDITDEVKSSNISNQVTDAKIFRGLVSQTSDTHTDLWDLERGDTVVFDGKEYSVVSTRVSDFPEGGEMGDMVKFGVIAEDNGGAANVTGDDHATITDSNDGRLYTNTEPSSDEKDTDDNDIYEVNYE